MVSSCFEELVFKAVRLEALPISIKEYAFPFLMKIALWKQPKMLTFFSTGLGPTKMQMATFI